MDLKAQAGGPIANPGEMAASRTLAIDVLTSIPGYVTEFKQGFGQDQITINVRNVEMTYPYFHDGAVQTLTDAVDIMGRLQLGKKLTAEENAKIVAFLKALSSDQPSFLMPILPPLTDKTPPPKPFG